MSTETKKISDDITGINRKKEEETQKQIFKILFENDEVSWKTIIFNLIEMEEMDPWDINVSLIAEKFLEMVRTLKEMDFRITGKIVLASAILLKLKSKRLVDEDLALLDQLINEAERDENYDLYEEGFPIEYPTEILNDETEKKEFKLIPRTPQPRKRKVSVYDLVEALEKALSHGVKRKERIRTKQAEFKIAERLNKKVDMSALMKEMFIQVDQYYNGNPANAKKLSWEEKLSFDDIVPTEEKEDKVLTFIPLLHLDVQRKIELLQKEHFGRINIELLKPYSEFKDQEIKAS